MTEVIISSAYPLKVGKTYQLGDTLISERPYEGIHVYYADRGWVLHEQPCRVLRESTFEESVAYTKSVATTMLGADPGRPIEVIRKPDANYFYAVSID